MSRADSKNLSQTYQVKRAQKVLKLSEQKLIAALEGKTDLPEKEVMKIALELYKRRVPNQVEGTPGGNQLTLIKIIKNHVPEGATLNTIEEAAEALLEKTDAELEAASMGNVGEEELHNES